MKTNLNFIKIIFISILLTSLTSACPGCTITVTPAVNAAATSIDNRHKLLERTVKNYYDNNILPLLDDIDELQLEIAKISVHMKALEVEANMDEMKLLYLLNNVADLSSLNDGENL